jgi:acetyl-CoA carboxylase carboxyl transferase subunit alpha
MSGEEILDQRKNKFLKIGRNKGFISNPENLSTLESKKNNLEQFYVKNKKIFYFTIAFLLLVAFLVTFFL